MKSFVYKYNWGPVIYQVIEQSSNVYKFVNVENGYQSICSYSTFLKSHGACEELDLNQATPHLQDIRNRLEIRIHVPKNASQARQINKYKQGIERISRILGDFVETPKIKKPENYVPLADFNKSCKKIGTLHTTIKEYWFKAGYVVGNYAKPLKLSELLKESAFVEIFMKQFQELDFLREVYKQDAQDSLHGIFIAESF